MDKICKYCFNLGIDLPHDHTVRDFQKDDYPIICPILLSNKCTYCHQKGHTKKYCSILKKKLNNKSNINSNNISNVKDDEEMKEKEFQEIINDSTGCTKIINIKKRDLTYLNDSETSSDEEYSHKDKKFK